MTKIKKIMLSLGVVSLPLFALAAVSCGKDTVESLNKKLENIKADDTVTNKDKIIVSDNMDKSIFKFSGVPSGYKTVVKSMKANTTTNTSVDVTFYLTSTKSDKVQSKDKTVTFTGFKLGTPKTADELTKALAKVTTLAYKDNDKIKTADAAKQTDLVKKVTFNNLDPGYEATEVTGKVKDGSPSTLSVTFKIREIGQALTSAAKTLDITGFKV